MSNLLTLNNSPIVLQKEGQSSTVGYKVTFPATAANWDKIGCGGIVHTDASVTDMIDYTKLSGKTFSDIVAIKASGINYRTLRMKILSGKIITIFSDGENVFSYLKVDGETTHTPMGNGDHLTWIPMADTVISSIEMYNTD